LLCADKSLCSAPVRLLSMVMSAEQVIHPAIKWFSNHFIKKQYYMLNPIEIINMTTVYLESTVDTYEGNNKTGTTTIRNDPVEGQELLLDPPIQPQHLRQRQERFAVHRATLQHYDYWRFHILSLR